MRPAIWQRNVITFYNWERTPWGRQQQLNPASNGWVFFCTCAGGTGMRIGAAGEDSREIAARMPYVSVHA